MVVEGNIGCQILGGGGGGGGLQPLAPTPLVYTEYATALFIFVEVYLNNFCYDTQVFPFLKTLE